MRRVYGIALLILIASMARAGVAACTLSTAGVAFGTYLGVQDRATATITVKCAWLSSYSISLSTGNGSGATLTDRTMTGPGAPALAYGLYSDSSYNSNWGAGGASVQCGGLNFGGCTWSLTVYGQVEPRQLIVPGGFKDTIIASSPGSASINIPISAAFLSYCLVPTTTALNFGTYKSAQVDATATITITCSNSTPYNIGINAGANSGNINWNWELLGPSSNLLSYKIYTDSLRTIKWGGSVSSDTVNSKGSGAAQPYTVYGRIAASQNVIPGAYSDTITFTLYY